MLKNYLILNGPNLNLLGKREPEVYGSRSFEDFFEELRLDFQDLNLHYFQSNSEGALLDKLHEVGFSFDGIILNAGAYTHTSIALRDAISGIQTPVLEVHISQVYAREPFRHKSLIAPVCLGTLTGLGLEGYRLGLEFFRRRAA